ncbi:hypothetical protein A6E15_12845 [Natrinema saccharevitans]|uniref:Uncharacterized protein n=1 Tax=Natrinema saccharevitans TaxID=301967 RepID=A0A1S8AYY5_9EURY|nr:hypothetical protein [Natrinema saccharevitans]OLZ41817.1 hypothetical protein A6E15_12845 [Natrinema saccharevitans]
MTRRSVAVESEGDTDDDDDGSSTTVTGLERASERLTAAEEDVPVSLSRATEKRLVRTAPERPFDREGFPIRERYQ